MQGGSLEEEGGAWRFVESPCQPRRKVALKHGEGMGTSRLYFDVEATNQFIAQQSTDSAVFSLFRDVSGVPSTFASPGRSEAFSCRQICAKTPPMAINRQAISIENAFGADDMMIEKFIQVRSEMKHGSDDESVESHNTDEEGSVSDMIAGSVAYNEPLGDDYDELEICLANNKGIDEVETPKAQRVDPVNPIPRKLQFLSVLNMPAAFPPIGLSGAEDMMTTENAEDDAMKSSIIICKGEPRSLMDMAPTRPKKHFDSDHGSEQAGTTGDEWSFSYDEMESTTSGTGTVASSGRSSLVPPNADTGVLSDDAMPATPNRASAAFARQQNASENDLATPSRRLRVTSKSCNDMRKTPVQAQRGREGQTATLGQGRDSATRRACRVSPKSLMSSPPGNNNTSSSNPSARSTPDGHFRRISPRSSRGSGSNLLEARRGADDSTPLVGELEL